MSTVLDPATTLADGIADSAPGAHDRGGNQRGRPAPSPERRCPGPDQGGHPRVQGGVLPRPASRSGPARRLRRAVRPALHPPAREAGAARQRHGHPSDRGHGRQGIREGARAARQRGLGSLPHRHQLAAGADLGGGPAGGQLARRRWRHRVGRRRTGVREPPGRRQGATRRSARDPRLPGRAQPGGFRIIRSWPTRSFGCIARPASGSCG